MCVNGMHCTATSLMTIFFNITNMVNIKIKLIFVLIWDTSYVLLAFSCISSETVN